jgi:hypothetical protein
MSKMIKEYIDEDYIDEDYIDEEYIDEDYIDEDYFDEDYTDDEEKEDLNEIMKIDKNKQIIDPEDSDMEYINLQIGYFLSKIDINNQTCAIPPDEIGELKFCLNRWNKYYEKTLTKLSTMSIVEQLKYKDIKDDLLLKKDYLDKTLYKIIY